MEFDVLKRYITKYFHVLQIFLPHLHFVREKVYAFQVEEKNMANDIQKNFNEKLQHFHLLCTNITMIVGFNSLPSSLSKVEQV